MNEQSEQVAQIPHLIFTESLEVQPRKLDGIYALAFKLAQSNGLVLALNASDGLRHELMAGLEQPVSEALNAGEEVTYDSGQSVIYLADKDLTSFTGLILLVGADKSRIELLKALKDAPVLVVPHSELQLADLAKEFPYAALAKIRPDPPSETLSETQIEGSEWFEDRYDTLVFGHMSPHSDRVELGAGEPQVCRYCGGRSPQVTFSNVSHAFPEQIGNKKLVDLRECDSCNKHFAIAVDDHFAKWTLASRTMGRIKGKKKVPSYDAKGFRVDHKQGQLNIRIREGDPRVKVDAEGKSIEMLFERQPYIPMGVFKCFVKMAIAVMPEADAAECGHLKQWLLEPTHSYESFRYAPLILYSQFVQGPVPNDKISYILLRRKAGVSGSPYLQFMVQFANYVHQIVLPMPRQDVLDGKATLQMRYFPHPWDTDAHRQSYGRAKLQQEDLSLPTVKRGDPHPMRFGFEELRSVPIS